MPHIALSLAVAAVIGVAGAAEVLILEDTFDGTAINISLWKHELTLAGGGNWEFELYTNNRSVSYVKDGALIISPKLTNVTIGGDSALSSVDLNIWGGDPATACTDPGFYGCERQGSAANMLPPIRSARLRTAESFAFRYGRVEVVAKLPVGDWLWPAVWLMPSGGAYGQWPASGEIDILESRGNGAGYTAAGGCDTAASTFHWVSRHLWSHKRTGSCINAARRAASRSLHGRKTRLSTTLTGTDCCCHAHYGQLRLHPRRGRTGRRTDTLRPMLSTAHRRKTD